MKIIQPVIIRRTSLTPFLLLLLLLHSRAKADAVTGSSVTGITPDAGSGDGVQNDEARGVSGTEKQKAVVVGSTCMTSLFERSPSSQGTLVVVCEGLQGYVPACARVPNCHEFMQTKGTPSTSTQGRRRRFAGSDLFSNWFGPSQVGTSHLGPSHMGPSFSSNSFHSYDPWQDLSSFGSSTGTSSNNFWTSPNNLGTSSNNLGTSSNNLGTSSNYHGSSSVSTTVVCPSQVDQSAIYQLKPDSNNYPVEEISQELSNDSVLRACLFRQVVLATDDPSLLPDDTLEESNATCPHGNFRLWQYQSARARASCWVLQNFQENVIYTVCQQRHCQDCKAKHSNGLTQNLCLTDFAIVSVWSFCPSLPSGQRILRDRLIISLSCSCHRVLCQPIPAWRK